MIVTPEVIRHEQSEWISRISKLDQETETLRARLQAIVFETQQLQGAIQACDVFLAKFDTNIQVASQIAPKDE